MANILIRKLTARHASLQNFRYYDLLVHIFVVVLLVSDLIAQKICAIGSRRVSAALLLFPITYIFGDVFTEVYGYAGSRRAIWIGFFSLGLLALMSLFAVSVPAAPEWHNQAAFAAVFSFVPRIFVASLTAFWAGEFVNSYVMAKMKLWTDGRHLWTRTVGSTVAGQAVDTTIVILLTFAGSQSLATIGNIVISSYLFKVAYEVLATPFTYLIVNFLKRAEGVDVYDRDTDFNPFKTGAATASSAPAQAD
jgi:queuosine precursor transporter